MSTISMDELVQYLYRETTPEKTEEIRQALITDESLREKLDTLALSKKRLDTLQYSPGKVTIDKILAYSKDYKRGDS